MDSHVLRSRNDSSRASDIKPPHFPHRTGISSSFNLLCFLISLRFSRSFGRNWYKIGQRVLCSDVNDVLRNIYQILYLDTAHKKTLNKIERENRKKHSPVSHLQQHQQQQHHHHPQRRGLDAVNIAMEQKPLMSLNTIQKQNNFSTETFKDNNTGSVIVIKTGKYNVIQQQNKSIYLTRMKAIIATEEIYLFQQYEFNNFTSSMSFFAVEYI